MVVFFSPAMADEPTTSTEAVEKAKELQTLPSDKEPVKVEKKEVQEKALDEATKQEIKDGIKEEATDDVKPIKPDPNDTLAQPLSERSGAANMPNVHYHPDRAGPPPKVESVRQPPPEYRQVAPAEYPRVQSMPPR